MPAKKKKKNPPVKNRSTVLTTDEKLQLVGKFAAATLVSGTIFAAFLGFAAYSSPDGAVPQNLLFQFLPVLIGLAAALAARPVKKFLLTAPSETVHATILSGTASLLVYGLITLLG